MEPITLHEVMQHGGWYWFCGRVDGNGTLNYVDQYQGVTYVNLGNPPWIEFGNEALHPAKFTGVWYGPLTPPWENEDE